MAMVPARVPRSVQPVTGLRLLTRREGATRPYSSSSSSNSNGSSAGRSSSRDGTPRDAAVAAAAASAPSTSTVSAKASTASEPTAVARSLSPGPTHAKKRAPIQPQQVNKRAFELPHVRKGVVGLDTFFATHRPLLELPLRLGARRSTTQGGAHDSAYVPKDGLGMATRGRNGSLENELVEVVDQAEDGTSVGEPYLVRLSEPEPLKSVEEELAAEAVEEAELAQQEEMQHELEATEDRPYEPWLLGQMHDEAARTPDVARYLAVRPPFTAPAPSVAAASTSSGAAASSQTLGFLAPFQSSAAQSSASSAPASTEYSSTFSSHFVEPLSPNEATGAVDRFLSHHEVLYRWAAQTDFVNAAGEALRRAGQTYSTSSASATATELGASKSSAVLEALRQQRGSVRLWTDADGYFSVPLGLTAGLTPSPFLPAEDVIVEDIRMDSVKRKRQKKIRKHKHRKRRKAQRALRQKLGK
ncbi:hypothetical protein BMF94_0036 [Rhodotorula taiwanensis]|uniref:Ribosomal protein mS38 C-terminal domain-containing protein n=1 Tax=Rhodotorula taiwanensis TaxID=741276 RepID=A0A2S5BJ44_9BASI|nr:hypothetical protein BMF94_0036 [Rhodotorula taiwanensis]